MNQVQVPGSLDHMRALCLRQVAHLSTSRIDRDGVLDAAAVVFGVAWLIRVQILTGRRNTPDPEIHAALGTADATFQWVRRSGGTAPLQEALRQVQAANQQVLRALWLIQSEERAPLAHPA